MMEVMVAMQDPYVHFIAFCSMLSICKQAMTIEALSRINQSIDVMVGIGSETNFPIPFANLGTTYVSS